jgi:hypothetical protein
MERIALPTFFPLVPAVLIRNPGGWFRHRLPDGDAAHIGG